MTHNEISKEIIDVAMKIHRALGPGLLESVYQRVMVFELMKRRLKVESERPISIAWEGIEFEEGFRADLLVDNKVIVELKSIERVAPVHKKILLTYLRLSDTRLGLLINFGEELLRDGISRIVNNLKEE